MIILLAGSSDIGRSAIADKVLRGHERWRHLPIEELTQVSALQDMEMEGNEEIFARIACHCAREMSQEGFHMILSMPYDPRVLPIMEEELEDALLAVHVGPPEEIADSKFPHTLNGTQTSVKDIYEFLVPHIKKVNA